jgi:hypothetical protein
MSISVLVLSLLCCLVVTALAAAVVFAVVCGRKR